MVHLITTTNFIGRSLADLLVSEGEDVALFGDPVEPRKLGHLESRVTVVRGHLAHSNEVLDVVRETRPEGIFHLGQLFAKDSAEDPWEAYRTNAGGTYNVLEAARLFNVPKVIYFCTQGTYGPGISGELNLESPQRPPTMYGATKLMGELLGRVYHQRFGVDFRCIRFPPLFGPGADVDTLSSYLNRIIQEPALGRPYKLPMSARHNVRGIYLKDASRAFLELSRAPAERLQSRFYLLYGVATTLGTLADLVRSIIPSAEITFDKSDEDDDGQETPRTDEKAVDESAARQEWGWRATFSVEDAVSDFIRDVQSDPHRYG